MPAMLVQIFEHSHSLHFYNNHCSCSYYVIHAPQQKKKEKSFVYCFILVARSFRFVALLLQLQQFNARNDIRCVDNVENRYNQICCASNERAKGKPDGRVRASNSKKDGFLTLRLAACCCCRLKNQQFVLISSLLCNLYSFFIAFIVMEMLYTFFSQQASCICLTLALHKKIIQIKSDAVHGEIGSVCVCALATKE